MNSLDEIEEKMINCRKVRKVEIRKCTVCTINDTVIRARCAGTQVDEGLCFFDLGLPVEDTFLLGFFLWKQVLGSKLMMRLSDWV